MNGELEEYLTLIFYSTNDLHVPYIKSFCYSVEEMVGGKTYAWTEVKADKTYIHLKLEAVRDFVDPIDMLASVMLRPFASVKYATTAFVRY